MSNANNKKQGNVFLDILVVIGVAALVFILCAAIAKIDINPTENLAEGFDGDTSECRIYDEYGIFDNEKNTLRSLNDALKEYSDELDLYIAVYIAPSSNRSFSDPHTEQFAASMYLDTFGQYTDGVIYYMDTSGKSPAYDFIYTEGKAMLIYNDEIEDMFKSINNCMPPSGQTVYPSQAENAIYTFLSQLKSYKKDFKPSAFSYEHDKDYEPSVYAYMKGDEFYITESKAPGARFLQLIIASFAGTLIAFLFYFITRHRYKFKSSVNPNIYVSKNRTVFNVRSDDLIRTYVTKHKVQSSSGGHRGGGGGGGFSSHGGGAHR